MADNNNNNNNHIQEEDMLEELEVAFRQQLSVANICFEAAKRGYITVLALAKENGWNVSIVLSQAALCGELPVLQWWDTNGQPLPSTIYDSAAYGGHLHIIQWAQERGVPWNSEACTAAAMAGRLDVLQYLRAHGCPWHPETCDRAYVYGKWDLLRWAYAHGAPCSDHIVVLAAAHGCILQREQEENIAQGEE